MRDGSSATELLMFTPLPPRRNGIADYAFEVLGGLAREFNCVAVVEGDPGEAAAPPGVRVISTAEYALKSDRLGSVLHLYQIGNNPDHAYLLPFLAERPGVAVLHDPSLHDLLNLVSAGGVSRYADALEAEHGLPGRILGEQFRRYGLRERRMFLDMPMIHGIAAPSRGVIVHSRYAAVKVLARAPHAPVTIVPHPCSLPAPDELEDPIKLRRALGVADREILFLSLGFVTRAKRIDAALRALAMMRDRLPTFKYVIAGELSAQEIDVKAVASALGLGDAVITLGYVEAQRLSSLVRAADVIVNLRYPVLGETSGTLIRALGGGGCCVVVDRGPFAEIPNDAAVRVAWGRDFESRLGEEFVRLAQDRELRQRIGARARAFILARHRLDLTVAGYKEAVTQAKAFTAPAWSAQTVFEFLPPHQLRETARAAQAAFGARCLPLWFEAGAVPTCDGPPPRTLVVGRDDGDLLARLGYDVKGGSTRRFDAIAGAAPEARQTDLAIVLDGPSRQDDDPGAALAWLNRSLAFGGLLIWYRARPPASSPHRPMADRDWTRLFAAYGFRVDAAFTGTPPQIDDPPAATAADALEDERCWRLYKVSETFVPPNALRALVDAGGARHQRYARSRSAHAFDETVR